MFDQDIPSLSNAVVYLAKPIEDKKEDTEQLDPPRRELPTKCFASLWSKNFFRTESSGELTFRMLMFSTKTRTDQNDCRQTKETRKCFMGLSESLVAGGSRHQLAVSWFPASHISDVKSIKNAYLGPKTVRKVRRMVDKLRLSSWPWHCRGRGDLQVPPDSVPTTRGRRQLTVTGLTGGTGSFSAGYTNTQAGAPQSRPFCVALQWAAPAVSGLSCAFLYCCALYISCDLALTGF